VSFQCLRRFHEGFVIENDLVPGAGFQFRRLGLSPALWRQDRRPVFPNVFRLKWDAPVMVPLAVLSAGVALEADANELPLAVPPAVEFVEMFSRPAIRAVTVGLGHQPDLVFHRRTIGFVLYYVKNQHIDFPGGEN